MAESDIASRIEGLSLEKRAALLQQLVRTKTQARDAPPTIRRQSRQSRIFPLSFAQQRLWVLDQLDPGSSLYNIPELYWVRGRLDPDLLRRAIQAVVARHESLRTTFVADDGAPQQIVAEEGAADVRLFDLTDLAAPDRAAEALRIACEEIRRPFDLARDPLLRVVALRTDEETHLLALTIHHIVTDGWSMGVLIREVATLYEAFANGDPSPLPDLPIQYADFAVWERQWLQGEALRSQIGYWKRQLDRLPKLQIPTDRPRPAIQSHRGATLGRMLPPPLAAALNALSWQEGCSLFITLLAAFQTLLARYTGQVDIPVGTVVANRNRPEIEPLIGFFVNTLVLRADLSGDPTFRELAKRVRELTLDAYSHQDLPFERLVDELRPERNLSHTPLFQVMFVLQNAPAPPAAFGGLTITRQKAAAGTAEFDLALVAMEQQQGLALQAEYATDLFDEATIALLLEHFQVLLEAIVAQPERRISELALLSDDERRRLLSAGGVGALIAPHDQRLHGPIEARAACAPDAAALSFEQQTLTYGELDRRANQLAHHLRALGVGPEDLVAVCMEHSPELVVALLGVLKAGAAYLPLNPTYPAERLAFLLDDSQARVLLTNNARCPEGAQTNEERVPPSFVLPGALWASSFVNLPVIDLIADWPMIAQQPSSSPHSRARPDNLAYVIYTSGSTGAPKGVLVSHTNAARLFAATDDWFRFGDNDVWTLFHSFAFDFSVWEIWGALRSGGRLVVVPRWLTRAPDAFRELLRAQRVSVLNQTPSAFRQLMRVQLSDDAPAPLLRLVIFGGETLDLASLQPWFARYGDQSPQLVNMYGITETTVHVTYRPLTGADGARVGSSRIGGPIPDLQLYVLDPRGQLAPLGVPGELHVAGSGVTRGYLGRPDLTAARFIPNPFATTNDERRTTNDQAFDPSFVLHPSSFVRLYRTGDLARRLPDGDIEYLGRIDQQVKIRGYRIELGEIATALRSHPAVREAVIVAREDTPGEHRLAAYLVARADQAPTTSELRQFLQEKLPEYMMPAVFVTLDKLPLNQNGKIDRAALPAPSGMRPELEADFIAPRTPVEEQLARIWAEVLGLDRVGVHDNFFALGGDSILNFKIIARARQVGIAISPRQVFQHQTIAELTTVLGVDRVVAEQGLVSGDMPLTPLQHWFLQQRYQHHDFFSIAVVLQAPPALTPSQWDAVVQRVVRQHDALRLRLVRAETGDYLTHCDPDGLVSVTRMDVSEVPDEQLPALIDSTMTAEQTSLSIVDRPFVRSVVLDRGRDRPNYMLFVCHHLVGDAFSWQILLADLDAACQQILRGEPIALPPKSTAFKHWAERLAAHARSALITGELDYWASDARTRVARLPVDYADGANTFRSARVFVLQLGIEETQALLREVPRAYDTQLDDALLAAMALGLIRWTGSAAALIDLVGHGRVPLPGDEEIDLSRTVGWVNIIFPMLLDPQSSDDPSEALRWVKQQLAQVPNRGMGYGMLRYLSDDPEIVRRFGAMPSAEVILNYLGEIYPDLAALRVVGRGGAPRLDPEGIRPHLLAVNAIVTNDQLQIAFEYSENIHRRATIEELAGHVADALRAIIAHIPALAAHERS